MHVWIDDAFNERCADRRVGRVATVPSSFAATATQIGPEADDLQHQNVESMPGLELGLRHACRRSAKIRLKTKVFEPKQPDRPSERGWLNLRPDAC
jgi:hypothetical protein